MNMPNKAGVWFSLQIAPTELYLNETKTDNIETSPAFFGSAPFDFSCTGDRTR